MSCVFCRIIKREEPAEIIYEDEYVISFYGLHSVTNAHVLVVPKKHIENVLDIEEVDEKYIIKVYLAIKEVAKQLGISETGFRVVTNIGEHGQQEVYHIHYHVIGGRQLKWEF
ncbi:HIT domain-containing protein [Paenibacillus sp. SYP-B3998]|uniref:HIT domain-containing protein n=1 Tax=Paenibacillus sp. SYP-B3998 TaxID=2678564 RepID=A0A6G3ZRX8_9BACL|nr:HIT domain-containing protein [Paenibacillus sp. SYP-B3998]NEW04892.1 HIT domain-containing protein [Paenibacillus sp. SYP-B3998]